MKSKIKWRPREPAKRTTWRDNAQDDGRPINPYMIRDVSIRNIKNIHVHGQTDKQLVFLKFPQAICTLQKNAIQL